ncbi:hypothetical protein HK101_001478, partial [Irineochytrium annulatum]
GPPGEAFEEAIKAGVRLFITVAVPIVVGPVGRVRAEQIVGTETEEEEAAITVGDRFGCLCQKRPE